MRRPVEDGDPRGETRAQIEARLRWEATVASIERGERPASGYEPHEVPARYLYTGPPAARPVVGSDNGTGIRCPKCPHGIPRGRCDVCEGGGPLPDLDPRDNVVWMTSDGPRPQILVPFKVGQPQRVGIAVADSSLRSMVVSQEPRKISLEAPGGHREVIIFSVPGAAAVWHATEFHVSTWARFWELWGGCLSLFEPFMIPPEDSTKGNWGGGPRAKKVRSILSKHIASGAVKFLKTVKATLLTLGYNEPKRDDLWDDSVHMDPRVTEEVNAAYWDEIDHHQAVSHTQHKIPLLLWDYNASSAQMQERWNDHEAWWDAVLGWANCDARTAPRERDALQGAVNALVGDGFPNATFYKVNLLRPAKVRNRDTELHRRQIETYELYNQPWCPLDLACEASTIAGIWAKRDAAEAAADAQGWPTEDAHITWFHWLEAVWTFTGANMMNNEDGGEATRVVKKMWSKNCGSRRLLMWGLLNRYNVAPQAFFNVLSTYVRKGDGGRQGRNEPQKSEGLHDEGNPFAVSVALFEQHLEIKKIELSLSLQLQRQDIVDRIRTLKEEKEEEGGSEGGMDKHGRERGGGASSSGTQPSLQRALADFQEEEALGVAVRESTRRAHIKEGRPPSPTTMVALWRAPSRDAPRKGSGERAFPAPPAEAPPAAAPPETKASTGSASVRVKKQGTARRTSSPADDTST